MRALLVLIMFLPTLLHAADLSWTAPTERSDGSLIQPGEIGGYKIFTGPTPDNLTLRIDIDDPEVVTFTDPISIHGHYYAALVYNIYGAESPMSPAVQYVPSAPKGVILTISSE